MNNLKAALYGEAKKFLRSKMLPLSLLALTLIPLMGVFFMYVLKNPQKARDLGLIAAKANILASADWASYLALLGQAMATGGLLVFAFNLGWIFGLEYAQATVTDLLALPVPRYSLVLAKFMVFLVWGLLAAAYVLLLSLAGAGLLALPGGSAAVWREGISLYFITVGLVLLVSTPVAFLASAGRGYLAPLSFSLLTLVLAQIIAATGYGPYFPWSVPALASGMAGPPQVPPVSLLLTLSTGALGLAATLLWWTYADHK